MRSINTSDGCGIGSWGCTISLYLHSQSYVMDFSQILGTYATKYTIVHELSHFIHFTKIKNNIFFTKNA